MISTQSRAMQIMVIKQARISALEWVRFYLNKMLKHLHCDLRNVISLFTEYPLHCTRYYGPHPMPCLETIWKSVKCLPEGHRYPSKLATTELDRLDVTDLRYNQSTVTLKE